MHKYPLALALVAICALTTYGQTNWFDSGLVAHYPFDSLSLKEQLKGNDLIDSFNLEAAEDRFEKKQGALSFREGFGFAKRSSKHLPDSTEPRSFSIWIHPTDTPSPVGFAFFYGRRVYGRGMGLALTNTRRLLFSGFLANFQSNQKVELNKWTHVGMTYDSDTAKLYINGTLDSYVLINDVWFTENNQFDLYVGILGVVDVGTGSQIADPFIGSLDDLRVYDRELSATEIEKLYQDELWPTSVVSLNHADMEAFPNPFTDHIQIPNLPDQTTVEAVNLQGKTEAVTCVNGHINTGDWKSGMYLLRFFDANGQSIQLKMLKS